MLAAIYGLLTALPQLASLAQSVWTTLVKLSGGDVAGYVVKIGTAFDQLNAAKTEADHAAAAKSIAGLIAHIPPK